MKTGANETEKDPSYQMLMAKLDEKVRQSKTQSDLNIMVQRLEERVESQQTVIQESEQSLRQQKSIVEKQHAELDESQKVILWQNENIAKIIGALEQQAHGEPEPKKVVTQQVTEVDESASKINALAFNLDLMCCRNKNIPSPKEGHNNIVLLINNYNDGIGDFKHGLSFAAELKKILKDKGYRICAVICVQVFQDKTSQGGKREQYVKNILASGKHDFDQWYLFEDDNSGEEASLTPWLASPSQINFIHDMQHAAMAFEISVPFPVFSLKNYLPSHVNIIRCLEYGAPLSGEKYMSVLTNASMGFEEEGYRAYGIKLYLQEFTEKQKAQRLLDIGKNDHNPEFIQHLLGEKKPTIESVENYVVSHYFYVAYLQEQQCAANFIVTQVLKNLDGRMKLKRNCDFLIPRSAVDQALISRLLQEIGFEPSDIAFVTEDSENQVHYTAKIRILMFFINDEEDYNFLYQMSEDGTGCSGDNSISLSFSVKALPFFQFKHTKSNFYNQLIKLVEHEISQCKIKPLQQNLILLRNYFKYLAHDSSASIAWCKKAAHLASQNGIIEAWEYLRGVLFNQYNYNNYFPDIVKTALYLSQFEPDIHRILSETQQVKELLAAGLDEKAFKDLTLDEILFMTASPAIIEGIKAGYISFEIMRMEVASLKRSQFESVISSYDEGMKKILLQENRLSKTYGQRLVYAVRAQIYRIDPNYFWQKCFDEESLFNDFVEKNKEKISKMIFELISWPDLVAVDILLQYFNIDITVKMNIAGLEVTPFEFAKHRGNANIAECILYYQNRASEDQEQNEKNDQGIVCSEQRNLHYRYKFNLSHLAPVVDVGSNDARFFSLKKK